jgi:hypothetical protein
LALDGGEWSVHTTASLSQNYGSRTKYREKDQRNKADNYVCISFPSPVAIKNYVSLTYSVSWLIGAQKFIHNKYID